jgi:hypothetical protein
MGPSVDCRKLHVLSALLALAALENEPVVIVSEHATTNSARQGL